MNPIIDSGFTARHRAVLEILRSRWADQLEGVEFLPGGYSNANFRVRHQGRDYVLRVVNASYVAPGVDRRRELSMIVGAAGTLAAPLTSFAVPEGHMLAEFVPGPHLDVARPGAANLARYLMRVHGVLGRLEHTYDLPSVLRLYREAAEHAGSPWSPVAVTALEQLRWSPTVLRGCHNDLNPWNVIVVDSDPDRWVTLDWEHAGVNDPWFDVLVLSRGLALSHEEFSALSASYAAQSGLTTPDPSAWMHLDMAFQLREYGWAASQLARGNLRREIAAQRDHFEAALASSGARTRELGGTAFSGSMPPATP